MNIYIVEDRVINIIINFLRTYCNKWIREQIKDNGYDLEDKKMIGCIHLAQAMHDLNCKAVNIHYKNKRIENLEDYLDIKKTLYSDVIHPSPFIFRIMSGIKRSHTLKALQCWQYQCAEYEITKDNLYILMNKITERIAIDMLYDRLTI